MGDWLDLQCPYCGERIEVAVDAGDGDQDYIEDCQVCCRPIAMSVRVEGPDAPPRITARRDDDA
jgi:hypothetical protein